MSDINSEIFVISHIVSNLGIIDPQQIITDAAELLRKMKIRITSGLLKKVL
jgi:hypothetical protein